MRPRHKASENVRLHRQHNRQWTEASMRPRHKASENAGLKSAQRYELLLQ